MAVTSRNKWVLGVLAALVLGFVGGYQARSVVGSGVADIEQANRVLIEATVVNADSEIYRGPNRFCGNTAIDHFVRNGLNAASTWVRDTFPSSARMQAMAAGLHSLCP